MIVRSFYKFDYDSRATESTPHADLEWRIMQASDSNGAAENVPRSHSAELNKIGLTVFSVLARHDLWGLEGMPILRHRHHSGANKPIYSIRS